ncbi:MAG: Gfo/Idh/MocA family protein [Candidatus Brocadiia bacterium]
MAIGFKGEIEDRNEIRAGFIGSGSHSFRNLYPTFQFTPVNLVSVSDLDMRKAEAFADTFGAKSAYDDHERMLQNEDLDAVFCCTGYDNQGRPIYPQLAVDCLRAGCHVWTEKPPAASCTDIIQMQEASKTSGKNVVVGMKKMFFPANEKARELMNSDDFGRPHLVTIQYPQNIPEVEEFRQYFENGVSNSVVFFLGHLCHPASLMVYLLGMPESLYYERSEPGGGLATFQFDSGALASIAFTSGASSNGGMERTMIVAHNGRHISVENNVRVTLHRLPSLGYGDVPDYYQGSSDETSASWEPEWSLGQLYNKGLFLLGYYNEINEFAQSILEERPPAKGTLEQAWQVTRIFEGFAEGPGKVISL